jgi:hypothetical protein
MARYAPISNVDYVEFELNRALEWLRSSLTHERFAACAVLHQLADNAPTTFSSRNREFFELIWGPLRDPKEQLRSVAVKALSACLAVMRQREQRLEGYFTVHDQIMIGLQGTSSRYYTVVYFQPRLLAVYVLKVHFRLIPRTSVVVTIKNARSYQRR